MKRRRKHRLKAEMNVVPYIDVMLVLLVIFMIAAPLIRQQTIKIDLPDHPPEMLEMPANIDSQILPLILTIDAAGNYYINRGDDISAPRTPEEIELVTEETITQHPDLPVIVQGDKGVPYEKIFDGIVLLQQAGASSVGLSGSPPKRRLDEDRSDGSE